MPAGTPLRLYGAPSDKPGLEWGWVQGQLESAGTYWVVTRTQGHPHPRPVWGVWTDGRVYLSIGTPTALRALADDPVVTVHLDSGTDVVIVEGLATASVSDGGPILAYNQKYDWDYEPEKYGPLQCVNPVVVLAWRTAGWAGRESFTETGRWDF
jgi:hypothetical protein